MFKKRKELWSFIFIFIIVGSVSAQQILKIPDKFQIPVNDVDVNSTSMQSSQSSSSWIVFSDRSKNKTYTRKDGAEKSVINFMDWFYVVEEDNEWVHIYKDEFTYGTQISDKAIDFGWIKKDHLLLWQHCVVTNEKIDRKVMLLNTFSTIESGNVSDDDVVKFYFDPEKKIGSDYESTLYQIFYIYKIDINNNSILVGKDARSNDVTSMNKNVVGWVPYTKVTFWDHRVALEPNWESEAVRERRSKGYRAKAFEDDKSAEEYMNGNQNAGGVYWESDPYDERNIGDWRRFPILPEIGFTTLPEGIFRAGVMGEVVSQGRNYGSVTLSEIQREYNTLRAKKRNINFVFVIDGTLSMGPYFKPVSEAISNVMKEIISENNGNVYRFGAVVYRDEPAGSKLTDAFRLTNDYQSIIRNLNNIDATKKWSNTVDEAMFFGLKTTFRQVGLQKDETNLIVLVGDAGSHNRKDRSFVPESQITDLLHEFRCGMLVFQTHNKGNEFYDRFIQQTENIILQSNIRKYEELVELGADENAIITPSIVSVESSSNIFRIENPCFVGRMVFCKPNETNSPDLLSEEIKKMVKTSIDLNEKLFKMVDEIIMSGRSISEVTTTSSNDYVNTFKPAVFSFLENMNISSDKLDFIKSKKYQLYLEAYIPAQVNQLSHPLFKPVLFLTMRELGQLLDQFDEVIWAGGTGNQRRVELRKTWISILEKHVGGISKSSMMSMTFEEIAKMVNGIPGTSSILGKSTPETITDQAIVPDVLISQYINEIKTKYGKLSNIYDSTDQYPYSFRSNDILYFWIEEDLLP